MTVTKMWRSVLATAMWVVCATVTGGMCNSTEAALVTQLDFTSGAVNWTGPHGRILDKLFAQDGLILTGQYQAIGQIMDPIIQGQKNYSLFTSGFTGAPTPTAVINGNSITVDLSALFFGWQRGDQIHVWNIGGQATGLFNPQTSEFSLTWDHVLNNGSQPNNHAKHHANGNALGLTQTNGRTATFFLNGTAILDAAAPVAIPASLYLFATGVFGIGSWSWWRRRGLQPFAS